MCVFLQVISWIRNGEAVLAASFAIPSSLAESNALSHDHGQFQVSAVNVLKVPTYT